MPLDENELEQIVHTRLRRVNAVAFAVTVGLLAGAGLFLSTVWLLIKGGRHIGPHLGLLGQFFIGYRVSPLGSLVGFAWAFLAGAVVGYAGAWVYNAVADLRQQRARKQG